MFPKGFRIAGIKAGFKKWDKKDLGIIEVPGGAVSAGIFTSNTFCAWPVLHSKKVIQTRRAALLLANSGQANAGTGEKGRRLIRRICGEIGRQWAVTEKEILFASTGVIGSLPDYGKIKSGLARLKKALDLKPLDYRSFVESIMTTDTRPKFEFFEGKGFSIFGCVKGSGMIEPRMATFLGFILTDFKADGRYLQRALALAAAPSFNALSVDGETSTNDSLFLLSSGLGKGTKKEFEKGLEGLSLSLARKVVADGEGVTKVILFHLREGRSEAELDRLARHLASSPLIKTAVHGEDPNWGRILCRLGNFSGAYDVNKTVIRIGPFTLFRKGAPGAFSAERVRKYLGRKEIEITISLGAGRTEKKFLTGDLSQEYVKINAHYTS